MWCGDCPRNITDCFRPGCVYADGNSAKMVAVNKRFPGPSIQVCESDIIVIEVENRVAGSSLAVHWAGQPQIGTPYMDGVPMITQCPIQPYTTFQYKFRASQHGTHFWKAHTGNELFDNMFGSLVVRRSDRAELMRDLYDEDMPEHSLIISEWTVPGAFSSQPTILINGIHSNIDGVIPNLQVNKGRKYRFRVSYAQGVTSCPVFVTVNGHSMLVIALDGHYVMPRNTSSVLIAPGERMDFILSANRIPDVYTISVESNCTRLNGEAKLVYNKTFEDDLRDDAVTKPQRLLKVISTVMREMCTSSEGVLCLPHIESLKKMPAYLEQVDTKVYLPFDLVKTQGDLMARMDNISFIFPPSPLISQPDDYYSSQLVCNSNRKPNICTTGSICECVHIIEIPLDNRVELILVDQGSSAGGSDGRIFHFHGYSFYIVGVATRLDKLSPEQVRERHKAGTLFPPYPAKAIRKDTVAVPKGGAIALRFKATNPGYWILHDHSSSVWSGGMSVVFKVGNPSDLPEVPDEFPVCGSFIGPEFFLI